MHSFQKNGITTFLISVTLAIASPALAETKLEINYETPSFKDKELASGPVKVSVSYNQQQNIDPDTNNLHYQISYNGIPQINSNSFTNTTGSISLKDLDNNKIPEVIITTFSGGAHCCTNYTIYTWNNQHFIKAETGYLDGGGGSFEDLDGDEKQEFVTSDNSFLYAFSSYAASFPPSRIYAFRNSKFENVTRKYVKLLN